MAAADSRKALRKFKFERRIGRTIVNPLVSALDKIGIRASSVVELETTGAKSGQPRRVPLTGRADDGGVWVISQHGRRAGWAHNIAADPEGTGSRQQPMAQRHSRVRASRRCRRQGPQLRRRRRKLSQSATALGMRALQSDPISVRITYTD